MYLYKQYIYEIEKHDITICTQKHQGTVFGTSVIQYSCKSHYTTREEHNIAYTIILHRLEIFLGFSFIIFMCPLNRSRGYNDVS